MVRCVLLVVIWSCCFAILSLLLFVDCSFGDGALLFVDDRCALCVVVCCLSLHVVCCLLLFVIGRCALCVVCVRLLLVGLLLFVVSWSLCVVWRLWLLIVFFFCGLLSVVVCCLFFVVVCCVVCAV